MQKITQKCLNKMLFMIYRYGHSGSVLHIGVQLGKGQFQLQCELAFINPLGWLAQNDQSSPFSNCTPQHCPYQYFVNNNILYMRFFAYAFVDIRPINFSSTIFSDNWISFHNNKGHQKNNFSISN